MSRQMSVRVKTRFCAVMSTSKITDKNHMSFTCCNAEKYLTQKSREKVSFY